MYKYHINACRWVLPTVCLLSGAMLNPVCAADLTLKSPDRKIIVTVQDGSHLNYSVKFRGKPVVASSAMGVTVEGDNLGRNALFAGKPVVTEINELYDVLGVHKTATNHCLSTVIPMTGGGGKTPWQLVVRVFNDGVAYRYEVPGDGTRHINGESSEWNVPVGSVLWSQNANNTSYESKFDIGIIGQLPKDFQFMAPATLKFPDNAGYGMMTEADLINYSDMSLQAVGASDIKAFFHNSPGGWNTEGKIVSPWRVTVLAADLNVLVNSDIIKNLCPPPAPELAHATWIKPGRSIWNWLSCYCAPDLSQQHWWVDRTREMGYDYYLIDDGWRDWNGGGDNAWKAMEETVAYAKSQGINIWLWVNAKYVFKATDRVAYFQRAKAMGIVGLKIDFPEPANAEWVNWYEDTLRDAASLELMIDFHGAVKPTGRERTWPNEMTREAIAGREQGKSLGLHDITLPFVRYVQGHADFTPTLFINDRLKGSSYAHELSMAVVYTSPFLCMGDNPSNYLNSVAVDVLKALPAVWDETLVLPQSKVGEIAAFARRNGDQWFIGVINDITPRRETISLNFLGKGDYKLVELADSPNRNDAFVRTERKVTSKDTLTVPLRKDGGYVAWLRPIESE
jgi:alpha-glucosidase